MSDNITKQLIDIREQCKKTEILYDKTKKKYLQEYIINECEWKCYLLPEYIPKTTFLRFDLSGKNTIGTMICDDFERTFDFVYNFGSKYEPNPKDNYTINSKKIEKIFAHL